MNEWDKKTTPERLWTKYDSHMHSYGSHLGYYDGFNNGGPEYVRVDLYEAQSKRIAELEANNNRQAQIITEFHKLSDDPADVLRVNQSTIITALSDRDKRIAELEAALFTIWGETKDLEEI